MSQARPWWWPIVAKPVAAGLICLAVAGLRVVQLTAFSDRPVATTTAVIESVQQGPFHESEADQRSFHVYAKVRYQVDGTPTRATVDLGSCGAGPCRLLQQRGQPLAVTYDLEQPDRARRAGRGGGTPFLDPVVLLAAGLGVLFLAAAGISLALEL